jgi:outer membrane immunogenic protein
MKNSLRICAVMAAALLSSVQAISADFDSGEPTGTYDWSGIYVGVHGGYTSFDSTILSVDNDFGGMAVGGILGGNLQMDQFVFGLEGDLGYAKADGAFTAPIAHTQKADYNVALRGRAGVAFDNTLLFVQGGLAWTDYLATSGGASILADTTMGYQFGAGIEHAVTDSITMRVDGLYTNYGKTKNISVAPASFDPSSFAARVGLNYKF